MENFYQILCCDEKRFRVFLNQHNPDVIKKFVEINKDPKAFKKFILVIEAIKVNNFTTQQYNFEGKSTLGNVFAIKVDQHRFYTLQMTNGNYREIFICRYGKKESQKNDKELTTTIKSIDKIEIQKIEL